MCSTVFESFVGVSVILYFNMVLLVLTSFLIAYARPCKSFLTNLSVSFHMMWVTTAAVILACWKENMNVSSLFLAKLIAGIALVPHILMISWAIYNIFHNIRCVRQNFAVFKSRVASVLLGERLLGMQESHENLLPDRLENSRDYRELTTSAGHAK